LILDGLKPHGYSGIDARSKVCHLMKGITSDRYNNVKTQILATAALREDFEACVNLYQDFIKQSAAAERTSTDVTIAAMHSGKEDGGDVEADMSVDDRYYKRDEYNKLSPGKKLGLRLKRQKRGHKSGGKKFDGGNGKNNSVNLSKRSIKALAAQVAKVSFADKDDEDDEASGSDEEPAKKKAKGTTNRNNPALKRTGAKK